MFTLTVPKQALASVRGMLMPAPAGSFITPTSYGKPKKAEGLARRSKLRCVMHEASNGKHKRHIRV